MYTHFLTQIPQPIQRNSEIKAILSVGFTSIHSFPILLPMDEDVAFTFLHSCAQRLGLQRFSSTIAIRVILSAMVDDKESKSRLDLQFAQFYIHGALITILSKSVSAPRGLDPSSD
ncbi:hypothetical protein B0F90DRAFT_1938075 [Multifurca ochricompacta]|uniref:Uncharacterized protein n=1 Tax=Multifurca ochricompacta TaxID=376703 RepID=A0AAD4M2A4_9AGAM|nr:hypothetical protein B0F90DRAFT_1938075 [Multifurca ochricompacta]